MKQLEPEQRGKGSSPVASLKLAVGGLLLLGIASRLLGLVREIVIAGTFGTSATLDAIYLGIALPLTIGFAMGGGIGKVMVPLSAKLSESEVPGLFQRLVGFLKPRVFLLTGVALLTSPLWAAGLVPSGGSAPYWIVALSGAVICLGIPGSALTGAITGVSHGRSRHFSANSAPLFHNITIIGSVLLLTPAIGPFSILVGIVLAEYAQCLVMAPIFRQLTQRTTLADDSVIRAAKAILLPAIIISGATGLFSVVDRSFAALLDAGNVSALVYAERLLNFPILLIGFAIQVPIYTRLSRFYAEGRHRAFEQTLFLGIKMLILLGLPVGALVSGFAEPIIAVLLQRGAFTAEDTAVAAEALRGYALAVAFLSMMPLLGSAGLAKGRPWAVAWVYLIALVVNGVLDAIMVKRFGILGISMVTSFVATAMALVLLAILSPPILRSAGFWRTLCAGFMGYLMLTATVMFFQWLVPPTAESFMELIAYLSVGVTACVVVTGGLFYPIWREELKQIHKLKNRAAIAGELAN